MEKIVHTRHGEVVEKEFERLEDLIMYVAVARVEDKELISLHTMGMDIEGIDGLAMALFQKGLEMHDARIRAEVMAEIEEDEEDEEEDEDEDYDEDEEEDEYDSSDFEDYYGLEEGEIYETDDGYKFYYSGPVRWAYTNEIVDDEYSFEPVDERSKELCEDMAEDDPEIWDGTYIYMSGQTIKNMFFYDKDINRTSDYHCYPEYGNGYKCRDNY